ncbi:hypothetical protein ELG63_36525 [Rhizobium leguminosarum]|uniref:hypothetical protein n=1 Tax=Rhizobium leguminosarum TaxID=384 RepID=UPI0010314A9F|nr:hypothetical protein [Rhizobium leguminosarum]TBH28196.1 hypothetical protein ELG63_36525 [Rhizobium leguminosarum]
MEKKINYYDRTAETRSAPVAKVARGATDWLRGETAQAFAERLKAGGETVTQQRIYLAYERVATGSRAKLKADLERAYAALYKSTPSDVRSQLKPGNLNKVQTMKNMPHYCYGPFAEMVLTNDDGTKTLCQLAASNFPAKVLPSEDGLHFRDVPTPKDGVEVRSQYFLLARRIDPLTGKPGDLDPNFTKDGIAFTPQNVRELVEKVLEVGRKSIRAERDHLIKTTMEENKAAGWPIKEKIDPRQINKVAGTRQGNVIRPQFPAYQERPSPSMKTEQEPVRRHAM